jgi:hypothetical protein
MMVVLKVMPTGSDIVGELDKMVEIASRMGLLCDRGPGGLRAAGTPTEIARLTRALKAHLFQNALRLGAVYSICVVAEQDALCEGRAYAGETEVEAAA